MLWQSQAEQVVQQTAPEVAQAFQRIRRIWEAGANRRQEVADLLAIYGNDWESILYSELSKRFRKENYQKLKLIADTSLNPLRWAVDKLAKYRSTPCVRSLQDAEASEDDRFAEYQKESNLDLVLLEASRLTILCREVLIRPIVREGKEGESPRLVYDIITPDCCEVVTDDEDPTALQAVIYSYWITDNQGDKKQRFAYWDNEQHWRFDESWRPILIEGNEENVNPYGSLPFVPFHARWPVGDFWRHKEAGALKRATIEASIAMTNLRHLMKVASFKQIVLSGRPHKDFPLTQIMDPSQPILVDVQGSGKAGAAVLDLQADFAALMETITSQVGIVLNTVGIRPEAFKGTLTAESGYALEIKNQDLQEEWDEQRRLADVWEQNLLDTTAVVQNQHDGLAELPTDATLHIDWPEVGPGQDPKEVLEYWSVRIGAKLGTRIQAIMAMDDVDKDEAKKRIKEIDAEQEKLSPLPIVPVMPQNEPELDPEPQDDLPIPESPFV